MEIRAANSDDAEAIAGLIGAMGYRTDPSDVADRLHDLSDDHRVLVADEGGVVLGWVHIYVDHTLIVARRAQLGGIAVSEESRGRGVATHLMEAAEGWARGAGCETLYVRSGSDREAAHRFYLARGMQRTKSQVIFVRRLS